MLFFSFLNVRLALVVYVYRLELVSVCFACIVATKLTVTVPVRAGEYNVRTTKEQELKNIETNSPFIKLLKAAYPPQKKLDVEKIKS